MEGERKIDTRMFEFVMFWFRGHEKVRRTTARKRIQTIKVGQHAMLYWGKVFRLLTEMREENMCVD
jgi:hypothetical protein